MSISAVLFFYFPWVMVQFKLQPQSLDLSKVLCVYDVNTQRNVKLEGGGIQLLSNSTFEAKGIEFAQLLDS
jgi:hypothetical protein